MFYDFALKYFAPPIRVIFRLKSENSDNLPLTGPVIVCCNHRANIDPVMIGAVVKRPLRFMAKAELFKVPLLSPLIKTLGAFPVNRGRGDKEAIKTAMNILKGGEVLAMFPEGHRLKEGGEPQAFKPGAAMIAYKTGADILPAVIVCSGKVRFYKRKTIRFGELIKNSELGFRDGGSENLKEVSCLLHEKVASLL